METQEKPKPQILILNDHVMRLGSIDVVLREFGYKVFTASTGKKALEVLRKEEIALLIQEIEKVEMDGWKFAKLLRADRDLRHIPILVLSSSLREDDFHNLLSIMDGYLPIPFKLAELYAIVQKTLDKHSPP